MSRKLLREADDVTFDQFQDLAFDTTLFWPLVALPRHRRDLERLQKEDTELVERVRPYLEHLLDWDCRVTDSSTQATLCITWFEEMFGMGYPAHTMHARYQLDRSAQLTGLLTAAESLQRLHGNWQVPWGEVHRIQRVTKKPDVKSAAVSFNGFLPSVPCSGAPGPLGIIYTAVRVCSAAAGLGLAGAIRGRALAGGDAGPANWVVLGETSGRGRMDRTHQRHGARVKTVLVYLLVKHAALRLRAGDGG